MEVPAESPGPAQAVTPVKSSGAGVAPSGNGSHGDGPTSGAVGPEGDGVGQEARDQNGARTQSRRRRGSRGGRGRSSSAGPRAEDGSTEGQVDAPVPAAPAANEADGPPAAGPRPVPERPKIGDSRPARPATAPGTGTTPNGTGPAAIKRSWRARKSPDKTRLTKPGPATS